MELTPALDEPVAAVSPSTRHRRIRMALSVVAIIVLVLALRPMLTDGWDPDAVSERLGWWTPVVSVLLMALLSWTFLPNEAVAVAHGAAYGFVGGTVANVVAWTISGAVQYAVSYYSFGMGTTEELRAKLPKWLRRFPVDSTLFLLLAHQVPFGSKVVSTIAPRLGISWQRRMRLGLVGLLPFAGICAGIGAWSLG
jgi:uncharacterized membrane protein YdjX (TVP38/TMEM64 family)